jgi:uncharacterized lipoprotein YbaY
MVAGAAVVPGAASAEGELRVQLLDLSVPQTPRIVAEQIVRTGWAGPMMFALRLPAETPLSGRKLAMEALFVRQGTVQARLKRPRTVTEADLRGSITLTLQ